MVPPNAGNLGNGPMSDVSDNTQYTVDNQVAGISPLDKHEKKKTEN